MVESADSLLSSLPGLSLAEMVAANQIPLENGFMCRLCKKVINHATSFRVHVRDIHFNVGISFVCPSCNARKGSQNAMRQHLANYHPELRGLKIKECQVYDE